MNYRHAYHAGNFADVLKHSIMVIVIEHLKKKAKPFFALDTHGGQGVYDLSSAEAAKTGEYRSGIARLLNTPTVLPELTPYVRAIRAINGGQDRPVLRYPGSPALIHSLLRDNDRLAVCELQELEVLSLRRLFRNDLRVKVYQRDGYGALKAFLPPNERRGFVLIDPPFETRNEFELLSGGFLQAHRRWPTATYLLWYPIKDPSRSAAFLDSMAQLTPSKIISVELKIRPNADPTQLNGCGLILVNPPWTIESSLTKLLPRLVDLLSEPGGTWSLRRLAEEKGTAE